MRCNEVGKPIRTANVKSAKDRTSPRRKELKNFDRLIVVQFLKTSQHKKPFTVMKMTEMGRSTDPPIRRSNIVNVRVSVNGSVEVRLEVVKL